MVLGDFNVVRSRYERVGSTFSDRDADNFNEFISSSGLHEFQMGARRFTRFNKAGNKMSKLDSFLVTQEFLLQWPGAKVKALGRTLSDHCPIMLTDRRVNYGPKPFMIFDHWCNLEEFSNLVKQTWRC